MTTFCETCKRFNCVQHAKGAGLTQRLKNLLEHFEEPEENKMRTYTDPEKVKPMQGSSLVDPRLTTITKMPTSQRETSLRFSDASLGALVTPLPRDKEASPTTSKAMVRIDDKNNTLVNVAQREPSAPPPGSSPDNVLKLTGMKYKAHERHHFVKIHASSFISTASPTGNYSELAFVLWVDNKSFVRYSTSTDRYRVILSLLYDAEDDLWCVSAKLLKRASYYSMKDDEEGHISNRMCMAGELRSEIKKMLLYLGISPRQAYRFFRRNMEESFVTSDTGAGFVAVETASHSRFMKELEKSSVTYGGGSYNQHEHEYEFASAHGSSHRRGPIPHNHLRDPDARNKLSMYGGYDD